MNIKSIRSEIINSKLVNLSDKNPNNIYGFYVCTKIFEVNNFLMLAFFTLIDIMQIRLTNNTSNTQIIARKI